MEREAFLRKLADTYHRGTLVPFIGAGMSMDLAPGWESLVEQIEKRAGTKSQPVPGESKSEGLIRRGGEAVRALRRKQEGVSRAVANAIYANSAAGKGWKPTEQSEALAAIRWPLVLSTNYEDFFHAAAMQAGYDYTVLGRRDAARVLASLSMLDEPILWALQGFVPRTGATPELPDLSGELVVGHAEYRRVTHMDVAFRRSFAEVFRRRSLLFLGSGMTEPYFLDLFEEIAELHGENPTPHYAVIPSGHVNADALHQRYGIQVLEYSSGHGEVIELLDRLKKAIRQGPEIGPIEWHYSLEATHGSIEVRLRRQEISKEAVAVGRALIISSGRSGREPVLSHNLAPILKPLFAPGKRATQPIDESGLVWDLGASPASRVLCVVAWRNNSERDLGLVEEGLRRALDDVDAAGHREVWMTLIATGDSANFPREYSLASMLRAIGNWHRGRRGRKLTSATIYLRDPEVGAAIAAQRLLPEQLLSGDEFQFTVEVRLPDGGNERRFFRGTEEQSLRTLAEKLHIPASGWTAEVIPRFREARHVDATADITFRDIGVIPGSTLRFQTVAGESPGPSLELAQRGVVAAR